jgi:integrase
MSCGADSRLTASDPKTASGRRQIALLASAVEALRCHRIRKLEARLAAGAVYGDHDLVFANETGGPLHPNNLARRFRQLSDWLGLAPIRFHDLRHTCATLMLPVGEHPKIVQERLGHTNVAMTMSL